jgi:membrane protease YdiL (CAAX protease family)
MGRVKRISSQCAFLVPAAVAAALVSGRPEAPAPGQTLMALFASPATHDATSLLTMALLVAFLIYGGMALLVLAAARVHGGAAWREMIGWHPFSFRQTGRRLWILVGATLAYGFAADLVLKYFHPPSETWFLVPQNAFTALAILVLAVLVAPIVEELVFRGYTYTVLRQRIGRNATIVLTAALFAILHYEATHLYALAVFPIGLSLGMIREMTGSIKPAILFHAFNNFLAFGFAYLGPG